MSLLLTWENKNTTPVTVKIYRGTTPIVTTALPAPIATLTAGETEYLDTTAVQGSWYYYLFETTDDIDRLFSTNRYIQAATRRGPGDNVLKFGDETLGFFGILAQVDFITPAALKAAVNAPGTAITTTNWYKYVRNGKILFVPESIGITYTLSWSQLYTAGLVFGVDGPGTGSFLPASPVNQKRIITIGTDRFLVRLARGYSDDTSVTPPGGQTNIPTDTFPCEYNDLFYPMTKWVPVPQRIPNAQQNTPTQLQMNATTMMSAWVQEVPNANDALWRGSGGQGDSLQTITYRFSNGRTTTAGFTWWPVLELIEE